MTNAIKVDYPKKTDIEETKFQAAAGSSPSSARRHIGYKLDSADDKQIVQVRLDTFAFSRLAPYDRWGTFRAEAQRLWQIYRDLLKPDIKRVGVRYINRIDLHPSAPGGVNLDDYFLTAPKIAPSLPQAMTNYFLRVQVPMDRGINLVITQTAVPPPDPTLISSLLDIDVFVQDEPLDDASAWARIENLRDYKNRVFEACITDKVRELID